LCPCWKHKEHRVTLGFHLLLPSALVLDVHKVVLAVTAFALQLTHWRAKQLDGHRHIVAHVIVKRIKSILDDAPHEFVRTGAERSAHVVLTITAGSFAGTARFRQ
jgi:hypothetical protein